MMLEIASIGLISAVIWPFDPPSLYLSIDRKSELAKKGTKSTFFTTFFTNICVTAFLLRGGGKGAVNTGP
jgi:hypothetical protein